MTDFEDDEEYATVDDLIDILSGFSKQGHGKKIVTINNLEYKAARKDEQFDKDHLKHGFIDIGGY